MSKRDSMARRVLRKAIRPLHRLTGRRRIAAVTRLLTKPRPTDAPGSAPSVRILLSHRISDEERLRILSTVAGRLGEQVGRSVPLTISDTSPEPLKARVRHVWLGSGTDAEMSPVSGSLPASLDELLRRIDERWFALHFDDMLTAGLSPRLLHAACRLLDRYADVLHVVCPFWPTRVLLDHRGQRIEAISYEVRRHGDGHRYRFPSTGWVRPVLVEEFDGIRFGVFENFTYGFFLNHLIAPVQDYRRRLAWYREHVHPHDAHAIELAAAPKIRGPWWTHVAVPLDGCTLVDLDYAHTDAAVRAERPELRAVHDAVARGWPIVVTGRALSAPRQRAVHKAATQGGQGRNDNP